MTTTSKAAHTPGPWTVERLGEGHQIVQKTGYVICAISPIISLRKDHPANARLIAAAPEMLEALKQLNIIIQAGGDFQIGPKGRHSTLKESLNKLIQKAEGDL